MLNSKHSLILISFIFISVFLINYIYIKISKKDTKNIKTNFMGSILTLFGLAKLYDLKKFSNIFQQYDIISKYIPIYSYIYPFIEIILGIHYIKNKNINLINKFTISIMLISIISVCMSLYLGQTLRCGCLGSFFHIPLSYVTLSENILMILMGYNL